MSTQITLLSPYEVEKLTTRSKTSLWRSVKRGDFPRPLQLSRGRVAWTEKSVLGWIDRLASDPESKA